MRFNPVECGKRMKALRESKNLTQMQLAEQLNISLRTNCRELTARGRHPAIFFVGSIFNGMVYLFRLCMLV